MARSIQLDDDLNDRIQHIAGAQHRTPDAIVRDAIAQYAEREEARERFGQEALDSWQHYEETGLHLTGKEVRAWLDTWGTDHEGIPPDCHK
ncbi:CopG family ribbon-helix-helix protein [Paraburkholderia bannensis]|uniref:CopG family ribbon-helix-helix protein n=1 Tax=Paraburkholderia bannensis TaxID=765414 RepID=UPI002AB6FB6A|nr:CopG family ribbon-helix-helix protein [Paraburkholderia bannensis]